MPRSYNKINLPTNTTDIQMFAKYLKAIDEKGIVSRDDEQQLFADVKIAGSRKDVKEPKRDTHTKQTLSLFGLIDILDDGAFAVSSLGKEVLNYYNSPESHSEEDRVALMLKVFMRWEVDDSQFNRHMHPGYLIVKLLCDPDLGYYFTNQEFADFVMNPAFVSDDQYDDIKKGILDFRSGVGISEHVSQSKAGTFLASLVSNWKILTSDDVSLNAAQQKKADQLFKAYQGTGAASSDEDEDEIEIENEVDSAEAGNDALSGSAKNANAAFHTIKKYSLIGVASYIAHIFIYLQQGLNIRDYNAYFSKDSGSGASSLDHAIQRIYFGAPGTGKSYKIKHDVIPRGVEPYRVTFYADYYYSDFVGGLRPKKGTQGIEYKFVGGPFAEALRDSFTKPTYLIIEEINRGNAAAIFGDIFQLLDRKEGQSEYSITNHDLYQYLIDEGVTRLEKDKVYLPSNLNIICTMNTADQNVFVLDTAFKRRFKMVYVPINFKSYYVNEMEGAALKPECKGYIENIEIFNAPTYENDLKVVMGADLYSSVSKVVKEPKRDWPTFASYINAKIDEINQIEQKISEDKKLGPFFVDIEELKDRKSFADKVIYYLKQDVFKYEDNILEESYESLYDSFVNNGKDIFQIFQPKS